jgi:NADH:ubiquinone oxidoreductase subunit F (NADH-binding)
MRQMPNWIKPTLTKGIILQKNSLREYLVKDIFSQKEIVVNLTGQETMLYSYEKEDIVYVAESEQSPGKGKLMTPTGLKYHTYLNSLKSELDKKYEAYIKINTKETK